MKLLHFIYDHINNPWVGGGGAVRCYEINKRLAAMGNQVTIVTGNYPGAKSYKEGNLEFLFVGKSINYYLSVFSFARYARTFLRENFNKYDIIIEDFAPWNPIFSYKLQKLKPVILQVHQKEGFNILRRYFILGLPFFVLEANYPKKFKNTITVSKSSKEKFKINAKIISNGIDASFLKEEVTYDGNYILFIGRIDFYHKGIDILLKAIENLNDIRLIFVGSGKDEKKLIKTINNKKNINYYGYLSGVEKINIIKNSRFVVVPSRFEAQAIVALEAAALGKPVIVSDIPELKYTVENKFGISFKSEDWRDLRAKIGYLWQNKELIKQMGENGRKFAQNYTWDKIAAEYQEFLLQTYRDFHSC